MSYQEPELFQDNDEADIHPSAVDRLHLDMLRLNSSTTTAAFQESPVTASLSNSISHGSIKKRSPPSFSSLQEPSPKRTALYPPSFTTNSPPLLPPPPPSSNTNDPNILHRSLSETTALSQMMASQSQESPSKTTVDKSAYASPPSPVAVAPSSALPPLPPATLRRSVSDTTSAEFQQAAATTPPRPQPARIPLRPPKSSDQESHESKRLERIKQRLKEMSQWVEKVTGEEDEEDAYPENNCNTNFNSEHDEPGQDVWVEERNGEGIILHFKCPCSKGYEIFLCGNSCYYRLM